MVTATWMTIWLIWIKFMIVIGGGSFSILEAASWYYAGSPNWTLSDCIRRWSKIHHWIPYTTALIFIGLWLHFFLQHNHHQ